MGMLERQMEWPRPEQNNDDHDLADGHRAGPGQAGIVFGVMAWGGQSWRTVICGICQTAELKRTKVCLQCA